MADSNELFDTSKVFSLSGERCISFGEDCSVDVEDFDKPCEYYKEGEPETVPSIQEEGGE